MEDKIIINTDLSKIGTFLSKIISGKNILILLIVPLILLLIDNRWIFPNPFFGMADDWLYTGYFLNFESFYSVFGNMWFGNTYFVGRLPWIIPGYVIYNLFPVHISVYVLHLLFYYCSVISLYLILKNTVSEQAGFISSLLFLFYPYFMREIGANYVSGAIIAYLLLALLMITKSKNSKNRYIFLFFAGFFSMLMLFSNLFTVVFLLTIGLYYIVIYYDCIVKAIASSAAAFALGAFSSFGFMCLFNMILTGSFDFYSPQIRALFFYSTWTNIWWYPISAWFFKTNWIIFPIIGIVISVVYIITQLHSPEKRNIVHLFFPLNYLILFFLFLGLELSGKPVLEHTFYNALLIPLFFLASGPFFDRIFKKFTLKNGIYFSYLCTVILIFGYFLGTKGSTVASFITTTHLWTVAVFIIAIFTFWYCFNQVISQKKLMVLGILAFCLFGIFYMGNFSVAFRDGFDSYENGYYAIMDSSFLIKETFPRSDVKFWYNSSEYDGEVSYGGIFRQLNSVYLWVYSQYSLDFPLLPFKEGRQTSLTDQYQNIVVLSTNDNAMDLVNLSFSRYDKKPLFISRHVIQKNKIRYNLILLKVPVVKAS